MKKCIRTMIYITFTIYIIIMIYLLYLQRIVYVQTGTYFELLSENLNLLPFKTISIYIGMMFDSSNVYLREHAIVNLVGNIVTFIPLGFFLPYINVNFRKLSKHLLICTIIITLVELTQLFTLLGSLDVDDLILNLCGTSIGYVFHRLLSLFKL